MDNFKFDIGERVYYKSDYSIYSGTIMARKEFKRFLMFPVRKYVVDRDTCYITYDSISEDKLWKSGGN